MRDSGADHIRRQALGAEVAGREHGRPGAALRAVGKAEGANRSEGHMGVRAGPADMPLNNSAVIMRAMCSMLAAWRAAGFRSRR